MPNEPTYWPVFRFNAGIIGEFDMIGIFTSEKEAQALADEVNAELPPEKAKAVAAEFTLGAIKSNIIQYWISSSFPERMRDEMKLLYGDKPFPLAVAKQEEEAAA